MGKIELANKFNNLGLQLKKHSPEILIGAGVIGIVTSAVLACKATLKASETIKKHKEEVQVIHDAVEHPELIEGGYTKEQSQKDLTITYVRTGAELVKLYAPSVILGGLSIASIVKSNDIMKQRNVTLAAAYTAVDSSFKKYRKRVVDRFGKELDQELRYNIKTVEVEEKTTDEDGKEKITTKKVKVGDLNDFSPFVMCYTTGCKGWEKDADHNKWFLIQIEKWANEKLKHEGVVFLNDIRYELGLPKTKIGQEYGWIYNKENPVGDNHIDLGIFNIDREKNRDFVNGWEYSVWLDPNVDGYIMDLI